MTKTDQKTDKFPTFTRADLSFLQFGAQKEELSASELQPRSIPNTLHDQLLAHRAEIESIDFQIDSLDHTITLERESVAADQATLEASLSARSRLLQLRKAMLAFVLELEKIR